MSTTKQVILSEPDFDGIFNDIMERGVSTWHIRNRMQHITIKHEQYTATWTYHNTTPPPTNVDVPTKDGGYVTRRCYHDPSGEYLLADITSTKHDTMRDIRTVLDDIVRYLNGLGEEKWEMLPYTHRGSYRKRGKCVCGNFVTVPAIAMFGRDIGKPHKPHCTAWLYKFEHDSDKYDIKAELSGNKNLVIRVKKI